jgi:hypothetical protein
MEGRNRAIQREVRQGVRRGSDICITICYSGERDVSMAGVSMRKKTNRRPCRCHLSESHYEPRCPIQPSTSHRQESGFPSRRLRKSHRDNRNRHRYREACEPDGHGSRGSSLRCRGRRDWMGSRDGLKRRGKLYELGPANQFLSSRVERPATSKREARAPGENGQPIRLRHPQQ